jgi:hypothetical protein
VLWVAVVAPFPILETGLLVQHVGSIVLHYLYWSVWGDGDQLTLLTRILNGSE